MENGDKLTKANEHIEELIDLLIKETLCYSQGYCLRVSLLNKARCCESKKHDCAACNYESESIYKQALLEKYIITI